MAKSKKIEVKNVTLTENIDNTLAIQGEEIEFNNLTEQIREMMKLGSALNIKISKARKSSGKPSSKKPIFAYVCPKCNLEVKSKIEDLKISCDECNEKFILKEEN